MRKTVVAGLCGIALGCAGSQVSSNYFERKARADGNPVRWEYACYAVDANEEFNKLGRQGWELVGWGGVAPSWCFKRAY